MKRCEVEGCTAPFYGQGLCKSHWMVDYRKRYYAAKNNQEIPRDYNEKLWKWIVRTLGIAGASERRIGF
jgi:hypothetical protein